MPDNLRMDTIDRLNKIRLQIGRLAVERDDLVARALTERRGQHVIARAAGLADRTVRVIASQRGIECKRGRPRKEPT